MKWRLFGLTSVLLALALLTLRIEAAGPAYPSHVNATMVSLLAEAHKTWRRDAVTDTILMEWLPVNEPESAKTRFWLHFQLYSPSNGAKRDVYSGGPNDGVVNDWPPSSYAQERHGPMPGLPEIKIDLPEVVADVRHIGMTAPLSSLALRMVGATGTAPLPAWTISTVSDKSLYPLPVNALDGKIIPWQRAYDPPQFTDAQMKAAWDRVLNRNQPQKKAYDPYARDPGECVIEIMQVGHC